MPPRGLSLSLRLWTTAILALCGFVALAFVAFRTIEAVKVNGQLYQRIVSNKDLLADILPPPAYLIESYLTCYELLRADADRPELLKRLERLEAEYTERITFWKAELDDPAIQRSMLVEAADPAKEFFVVLKAKFIQAIRRNDLEGARAILEGELTNCYTRHRAGVDKTVDLANKQVKQIEAESTQVLSASTRSLLVSIAAISLLVLLLTYLSIRSIMTQLNQLMAYARAVSRGEYAAVCTVSPKTEFGRLSAVLAEMVDTVKASLSRATDAEQTAKQQAANATQATIRAEEALAKAESAKQQGMQQAALKLERVADIVGKASARLSEQIKRSHQGSCDQAERAAKVARAMDAMNDSVHEVADNAAQAAKTATTAQEKAGLGASVVTLVIDGIGSVQQSALALKTEMTDLGMRSDGIGQILNVISDIADQTNLLALNAAIEAARAGDAGRGFAVVADEVRKLAEKTMTATKQVDDAIKGVQNSTRANIQHVEEAVRSITDATGLAGQSGEGLKAIVNLIGDASGQVHSIASASEQQSSTSREIFEAMEQVKALARESSTTLDEAATAVSELASQAAELLGLIQELKGEPTAAR